MIAEAFKGWVGETQALAVFAVGISWRRSPAERPMFPPNLAAHLHLHVHSPRLAHPDQAPYATNLASTDANRAWVNTSLARPNTFLARPNRSLARPNALLAWGNTFRLSAHRREASLETNQTWVVAGEPYHHHAPSRSALTLVSSALTLVSGALTLVSGTLTLVSSTLTLAWSALPQASHALPQAWRVLPPVSSASALASCGTPPAGGWCGFDPSDEYQNVAI